MSRKHPRVRVRFAASVQIGGVEHTLVCHTRDISTEGCFLDTSEHIAEGVPLSLAIMDNKRGEVIQADGVVARVNNDGAHGGIGVRLVSPPDGWHLLVERYQEQRASDGGEIARPQRLSILVVGESDRRRGAMALYVTSGWDVRFAVDLVGAIEALHSVSLDAVIAEADLADNRVDPILDAARRIQPQARRLVRCPLGGAPLPQPGGADDLVHEYVDEDSGIDALVVALAPTNTPSPATM